MQQGFCVFISLIVSAMWCCGKMNIIKGVFLIRLILFSLCGNLLLKCLTMCFCVSFATLCVVRLNHL